VRRRREVRERERGHLVLVDMRVSLSDHERHLSVHIESWRAKNIERRLGVLWSERERERE
jgi:hypothetical protein